MWCGFRVWSLLDVEDGVGGVRGGLVLRGITDETLRFGKGHVRGGNSVSLVVYENLDLALLHHTDAGVCSTQVLEVVRLRLAPRVFSRRWESRVETEARWENLQYQ